MSDRDGTPGWRKCKGMEQDMRIRHGYARIVNTLGQETGVR